MVTPFCTLGAKDIEKRDKYKIPQRITKNYSRDEIEYRDNNIRAHNNIYGEEKYNNNVIYNKMEKIVKKNSRKRYQKNKNRKHNHYYYKMKFPFSSYSA